MATKKKNTPQDPESKTDPIQKALRKEQSADQIWQRLLDLSEDFRRAALHERRQDLRDVGLILSRLAEDREFREVAHKSLQSHLNKKFGYRPFTKKLEGYFLLETVEGCIEARADAELIARLFLHDLKMCPDVYIRENQAPRMEEGIRYDRDQFREAVERVTKAIRPVLYDPDAAKENPEAFAREVVRAALRALGYRKSYWKNLFQSYKEAKELRKRFERS